MEGSTHLIGELDVRHGEAIVWELLGIYRKMKHIL